MPTQKITIPASSTDQVLTLTLPDNVPFTLTGGTPIVTPPPVVTPPPPVTGVYSVIYKNGMNTQADLDPFGHNQYGAGKIVQDGTAPEGTGYFKSRPANVSSGIRSEISFDAAQTPLEGAMEWKDRFNVIVPDNGHSAQFHPSTSGGSASPGRWFVNGKFDWHNWHGGTNDQHPTGIAPIIGAWNQNRIEYKFGKSGYFRHWFNGVLICNWTGLVGDGSAPYFKLGYNGWDGKSTSSDIDYDDFIVYKLN